MSFEFFISRRHLIARRSKMLSVVSWITVLGVAFGVMALLVTLAIVNGFRNEYEKSILAFNAHVIVMSGEAEAQLDLINKAILKEGLQSEVRGTSPFVYREGLAVQGNLVRGMAVKGVDLKAYQKFSGLEYHQKEEAGLVSSHGIWLGQTFLDEFPLKEQALKLRLADGAESDKSFIKLPVVGSFVSGLYDYDATFALMDLAASEVLLGQSMRAQGIEIWLKDASSAEIFSSRLSQHLKFPYTVLTWRDLNANLFGALQLERLVFAIIMGALILVASFNITGTLTMRILEHRGDIAILRAMGATWRQLKRLFFYQGLALGWSGCSLGILLGVLCLEIIRRYQPLKLEAEIYFIEYVPAEWNVSHILITFAVTTLFSWLAARVALFRLRRLSIVQALGEI
jgi:lipoprotein-releasing system permease protein